jgi:hypothetical protein
MRNAISTGRELVAGRPEAWARDFGLVGLACGVLAPAAVAGPSLVFAFTGLAGAFYGVVLGLVAPRVLERVRGRVPLPLLAGAAVGVGAAWGAATAMLGTLGLGGLLGMVPVAATAGALVTGAVFLPYTVASVMRLSTWPIVVAASAAAPILGWLSLWLVAVLG